MDCTEPKIELTGPDCDGFYRWREWVIARGVTSNRWVIRTAGGKYLAGSYDTPEAAARALAERGYGPGAKAEAAPEGPRWEHHQPDTYLGRHGEFDLYFSTAALSIGDMFPPPYVYARFGSDAGAHWWAQAVPTETIVDPAPHVQTARRLARERGLLPEPLPALPDGFDAAKIPPSLEWTGEYRLPRKGEWFLRIGDCGAKQAEEDLTWSVRPILRHKPKSAEPQAPTPVARETRIRDMRPGEYGYTVPWVVTIDDGAGFLDGHYPVDRTDGGTLKAKVERREDGYHCWADPGRINRTEAPVGGIPLRSFNNKLTPLPPTPATLPYRDAWPTPKAAGPEPKENPMPPKDEAAPQGRALTTEEFDQMVELAKTFRHQGGGYQWDAPIIALEAHVRWLHLQVDPSAEFDEPAPAPTPTPSAYVQTLQPIPGAFARFASAAGVAVVTALATIAGLFGGVALAVKFHLIG